MTRGASAVYLRQNALAEPLDNQWSAWPYLVSPVTAPMSVGNLHLRLMESFVANPQVHIAALKNPEVAGGPFLSHDESKVCAVARRYEIQRTRFVRPPGMALRLQVIDEDRSADLYPSDLQRVSLEEQSRELDLLWDDLWSEPFELESASLLRARLVTLSTRRHALLLFLPALCADALGLYNLVREIRRSYAASESGEGIRGPVLQYADVPETLCGAESPQEKDSASASGDGQRPLGPALLGEDRSKAWEAFEPRTIGLRFSPEIMRKLDSLTRELDTSLELRRIVFGISSPGKGAWICRF